MRIVSNQSSVDTTLETPPLRNESVALKVIFHIGCYIGVTSVLHHVF